jgi:hypothetical protein
MLHLISNFAFVQPMSQYAQRSIDAHNFALFARRMWLVPELLLIGKFKELLGQIKTFDR